MISVQRVLAVARASVRDLFAGQATALLLLFLGGLGLASEETRAATEAEACRVAVRQREELVLGVAAVGAALAAAHAVAEARRTRRLAQWCSTPLTPFEELLGEVVGSSAGVALLALVLQGALLFLPARNLLHQRELFAPRDSVTAAAAGFTGSKGERERWRADSSTGRRSSKLLDRKSALEFTFEQFPATARGGPVELVLPVHPVSGERDATAVPPHVVIFLDDRAIFSATGGFDGEIVVPLPSDRPPPLHLTISFTDGDGVVRVAPAEVKLRGPPGSITSSWLRAACGLVVLVFFAAALAATLATFLPDALAFVASLFVLLLGALRPLLIDVADAVAASHIHVSEWTRSGAAVVGRVLLAMPDLAHAAGADALVRAEPAWTSAIPLLVPCLHAAIALLVGGIWLRRRRGDAP